MVFFFDCCCCLFDWFCFVLFCYLEWTFAVDRDIPENSNQVFQIFTILFFSLLEQPLSIFSCLISTVCIMQFGLTGYFSFNIERKVTNETAMNLRISMGRKLQRKQISLLEGFYVI